MATLNPYLNFNGTTEEAFNFYRSVFGGEFLALMRFSDTDFAEKLPEADRSKIMHIALAIGKGNMIMATDALECMGQKLNTGDDISLCLSADSLEEAERLFNALSTGGTVTAPLKLEFWGDYFGMLKDPFGKQWMITFSPNRTQS